MEEQNIAMKEQNNYSVTSLVDLFFISLPFKGKIFYDFFKIEYLDSNIEMYFSA